MSADSNYSTILQKAANKLFPASPLDSALDTSAVMREMSNELQRRDFCSLSNLSGEAKLAWWNAEGRILFVGALYLLKLYDFERLVLMTSNLLIIEYGLTLFSLLSFSNIHLPQTISLTPIRV